MKVVAITKYNDPFPAGVAKIPEGRIAQEVFIAWIRKHDSTYSKSTDAKIWDACLLEECQFCYSELEVEDLYGSN